MWMDARTLAWLNTLKASPTRQKRRTAESHFRMADGVCHGRWDRAPRGRLHSGGWLRRGSRSRDGATDQAARPTHHGNVMGGQHGGSRTSGFCAESHGAAKACRGDKADHPSVPCRPEASLAAQRVSTGADVAQSRNEPRSSEWEDFRVRARTPQGREVRRRGCSEEAETPAMVLRGPSRNPSVVFLPADAFPGRRSVRAGLMPFLGSGGRTGRGRNKGGPKRTRRQYAKGFVATRG